MPVARARSRMPSRERRGGRPTAATSAMFGGDAARVGGDELGVGADRFICGAGRPRTRSGQSRRCERSSQQPARAPTHAARWSQQGVASLPPCGAVSSIEPNGARMTVIDRAPAGNARLRIHAGWSRLVIKRTRLSVQVPSYVERARANGRASRRFAEWSRASGHASQLGDVSSRLCSLSDRLRVRHARLGASPARLRGQSVRLAFANDKLGTPHGVSS